ncbi:MAG: glycosyltransferase family 39 protein [Candidatus Eisenbacteria bacterium]
MTDRKPAPARRTAPLLVHAAAPSQSALFARLAAAAIAAWVVLVVVVQVRWHEVGDVFTETDFYGAYALGAKLVQQGRLDPSRYAVVGPVYEIALALVGLVVRDLYRAAQLLSLAGMAAALFAWRRIWIERAGAGAALAGTLLLVANGQVLRWGYSVTTDALALGLLSLAALLLVTGERTPRRAAMAGAVAGLAFLTRYSAVALLPAGLAIALLEGDARARTRTALAFAAGFFAPVLPWVVFSLASGAHFAFQLHHNVAYEVFARSRGIPWDTYQREMQPQFPTPWSVLARDPGAVLARMALNVAEHFRLDATKLAGLPVAIAAAVGAVLAWRDGTLRRVAPVLWIAAATFLALVPAFHSERYSLPLLPAWATLAALAFASPRFAFALDAGAGRRAWLKAGLLAVPLVLAGRDSLVLQARTLGILPLETQVLGREARAFVKPGDKVMARKPHFAWYAGLEPVPFPFADSLSQVAAAARAQGVRWLYFSWPEAEMRPAVSFLLDTTSRVPGLRVVRASADHPAVLYEILPGFGENPAWLANDALLTLHRARAKILIDRTDWRSRVYVALYEREQGRFAEAQALLDQALPRAGEEPEVLLLAADNLLRVNSPGAARAMLDRAERVLGPDPRVLLARGWAADLDANTAEAARWWRPVIGAADARTLARMLDVFAATGDAEARAAVTARLTAMGERH